MLKAYGVKPGCLMRNRFQAAKEAGVQPCIAGPMPSRRSHWREPLGELLEEAFQEDVVVGPEPDAVRVRSPNFLMMAFNTPLAHAASHILASVCLLGFKTLFKIQGPRSKSCIAQIVCMTS